jgi:hypothetical protein
MAKLTLLVRAYCHLCDDLLADLQPLARAHGASVDVIDVDAPENAALETEWGERVPALFAGAVAAGTLLCHYHLDVERVARALDESGQPSGTGRVPGQNPL